VTPERKTRFTERCFAPAFLKGLAAVASGGWSLAEFDRWLADVRLDAEPIHPERAMWMHGAAAVGRLAAIAKNADEQQPNTREEGEPHGKT